MANDSLNQNACVVLRDVSKDYNGFRALDNVSFEIREGEIFGYIGPNGAGKTTTLKILVGLINDFQGEVLIGGYRLPKQKFEAYRLLGYLPQNVAFQEWRTVDHALKTFGKLSGLTETEVEERIPKILDLMSLSDVRHKKISQLSGGMTQKVGLAQALLHDPKLLVLDEPLGGLDPLSRHQFKEIVLKLAKKGTTILFSSHILSDVQDVADRIGILSRGKIKMVGSMNELKSQLSNQKIVEVLLSYVTEKWQELGSIRNISKIEQPSPGRVLVYLQTGADEDQVINDIVQSIAKFSIRIRGITLLSPSLDEIYLNYVQKGENA
ncbi:MAG: ABC transporter ATP-binding protein [Candidatus Bathyarchaeota archaeon]|nr:ABC transporter ATP-binding protein [Candidatus Bathyarchaeota archaeon]